MNYRKIVIYDDFFIDFLAQQNDRTKQKIHWTLGVLQEIQHVLEKYLRHLKGTELYEVRVLVGRTRLRVFCFFAEDDLIVLLHGFIKKTRKTPRKEIDRAMRLQQTYRHEQRS